MDKVELHNRLFDTVLKTAVAEDFQRELDAIPPEEVLRKEYAPSQELRQEIQKTVKNERHKTMVRKAAQYGKRVAILIAIIIPISLGSLISVEASRNAIFNSVMEWKADHVDIYFQEENLDQSPQSIDENSLYKPQYLPEGFTESETVKFGATQRIIYRNNEKVSINFEQTPLTKEGTTAIDTEHTTYKEITLNGQKVSLFAANTAEDKTYLLWQSKKISFMLNSTIDQQELIKIAETIIKRNN